MFPQAACASQNSSESDIRRSYSERTLAIIKPEAYEDSEPIINTILDNGYAILAKRTVQLSAEQAADLYKNHYGGHYFPHLVAHMSSGPIIAMVLATQNCIEKWKTLIGPPRVAEAQAYWPESLRACYGRRTEYGEFFNGLHGSENHIEAVREIHFFFPNMIIGPILRRWQVKDYIQRNLMKTLLPGITALATARPDEPLLWLADYLRKMNPNEPEFIPHRGDAEEAYRCLTPEDSESDEN